ncbi:hypothetical protein BS78_06G074700 [Paspalum vaginatum]|nr:hypothetical protein BS78_06G074700 [Paspalum vaginatum]
MALPLKNKNSIRNRPTTCPCTIRHAWPPSVGDDLGTGLYACNADATPSLTTRVSKARSLSQSPLRHSGTLHFVFSGCLFALCSAAQKHPSTRRLRPSVAAATAATFLSSAGFFWRSRC